MKICVEQTIEEINVEICRLSQLKSGLLSVFGGDATPNGAGKPAESGPLGDRALPGTQAEIAATPPSRK